MILCPARLEPIFSPRPWGRFRSRLFSRKISAARRAGRRSLDDRATNAVSRTGLSPDRKLGEAWPNMPREWSGTRADAQRRVPFAREIHFLRRKAFGAGASRRRIRRSHENCRGRARQNGNVVRAARATRRRSAGGAEAGRDSRGIPAARLPMVLPKIASRTSRCSAGEAIFVPAGTAHTIGPGLVLCEIQQHSDLTYRVFDYNRRDANGRGARTAHREGAAT